MSMQLFSAKTKTQGQGALIGVALVLLAGLVLVGLSTGQLGNINARRTLAVEGSLETYYIAQAGLQEALANRMVPRSNESALTNREASAVKPFNPRSGLVYLDPGSPKPSRLLGIYRYLVVGGDLSRDPETGDWLSLSQQPGRIIQQPFYVISQGAICRDPQSKQARINAMTYNTQTKDVQCGFGQVIDRTTVLAKVDYSRTTINKDKVASFQVVDSTRNIALDKKVWVPCQGVTNSVSLNTAYGCTTFPAIHRVAFYQPGQGSIINVLPPYSTNPVVPQPSVIRVILEGLIDPRTVFTSLNQSIAQCASNPALCNVKLRQLSTTQTTTTGPLPAGTIIPGGIHSLVPTCFGGQCTASCGTAGSVTLNPGDVIPENCHVTSDSAGHSVSIAAGEPTHYYGNGQFGSALVPGNEGGTIGGGTTTGGGSAGSTTTQTVTTNALMPVTLVPVLPSSSQIVLASAQPLPTGSYQIELSQLQDYNGNTLAGVVKIPFQVAGSASGTTPPPTTPPVTTPPSVPPGGLTCDPSALYRSYNPQIGVTCYVPCPGHPELQAYCTGNGQPGLLGR